MRHGEPVESQGRWTSMFEAIAAVIEAEGLELVLSRRQRLRAGLDVRVDVAARECGTCSTQGLFR